MFKLNAIGVHELPEALEVLFTGDLGTGKCPPEYHFVVMALGAQLDQSQCYAILDLEEVNIDSFPQLLALQDKGTAILGWSGDEFPEMLGYGGMGVVQSQFGPMITMHFGGSPMNSAFTVYIVPEQLLLNS